MYQLSFVDYCIDNPLLVTQDCFMSWHNVMFGQLINSYAFFIERWGMWHANVMSNWSVIFWNGQYHSLL